MSPSRAVLMCRPLAIGFALLVAHAHVHAARLGEPRVLSALGEPLRAVIPIEDEAPGDAEAATPELGSPARYELGGLDFPEALRDARVSRAKRDDGRWVVRIEGTRPVDSARLVLLVTLDGPGYTSARTYVVSPRPAGAPAPAPAPASTSKSAPASASAPPSAPAPPSMPPPESAPAPRLASTPPPDPGPAPVPAPRPEQGAAPAPPSEPAAPVPPRVVTIDDPAPVARPAPAERPVARPTTVASAAPPAVRRGDRLVLAPGGTGRDLEPEGRGEAGGRQRAIAHEAAMSEARSRIAQLESIQADLLRLIAMRERAIAEATAALGRPASPSASLPDPAEAAVGSTRAAPSPAALPGPSGDRAEARLHAAWYVAFAVVAIGIAATGLRRRRRVARDADEDGVRSGATYPLIDPTARG